MQELVQQSLGTKYSHSLDSKQCIDNLLEEVLTPSLVAFHESNYDREEELLKREYA